MSRFIKAKKKVKAGDYITSLLFIMPVLLGILLFTLIPMASSFVFSFTEYKLIYRFPTKFIGFDNYIWAFTGDWVNVGNSLWRTFAYAFISLPLTIVLSFAVALALVKETKGIKLYRTLIYLPVLLPAVVGGLLWTDILDYNKGVVNMLLQSVGLPKYGFYSQESTALPTFIGTSLFGIGGSMVLWIAQIKNIPDTMIEAAKIEGAGYWRRLFKIVIPMCTPMIFYNLVLGIIGALQVFASAMVVSSASTGGALSFLSVYIYQKLQFGKDMGYVSALSWILFVIIGLLTLLVFATGKWVYYGDDE